MGNAGACGQQHVRGALERAGESWGRRWGGGTSAALDRAWETKVLGDGATYIWNLADEHFYYSLRVVDWYRAPSIWPARLNRSMERTIRPSSSIGGMNTSRFCLRASVTPCPG